MQVLPKALSAHGVLVAQVGEAADRISPAESNSVDKNRAKFLRSLVDLGFVGIRDYHEVWRHPRADYTNELVLRVRLLTILRFDS